MWNVTCKRVNVVGVGLCGLFLVLIYCMCHAADKLYFAKRAGENGALCARRLVFFDRRVNFRCF